MTQPPTIAQVLDDPAASDWLKACLRTALTRDPVDAATDAETLLRLLDAHAQETLHRLDPSQPGAPPVTFDKSALYSHLTIGRLRIATFTPEFERLDESGALRTRIAGAITARPGIGCAIVGATFAPRAVAAE